MRLLFIYHIFFSVVFISISSLVFGQDDYSTPENKTYLIKGLVVNTNDEINPETFSEVAFEQMVFDEVNRILASRGFEPLTRKPFLDQVSLDQADYMALADDASTERPDKTKATTALRLQSYGGSSHGQELVAKSNLNKGPIVYTYAKVRDDIVLKWFASAKTANYFQSGQYNHCGISAKLDQGKKRVYISFLLGNYKTPNLGVAQNGDAELYTTKLSGLKPFDEAICKKVVRATDLNDLQKGLYVEDKQIYFETDNIKTLKKVIKEKSDAVAVDFVQPAQFKCNQPNTLDHNNTHLGIVSKKVAAPKLYKNNLADVSSNRNGFKAYLGEMPEGVGENYEMNLVLIQDKHICASIPQSFIIQTTGTYTRKVQLLADTVTINSKFNYKPVADSMELSLRIPFENNKYTYRTEDIEPFIKLLNEPAFLIYELKITALSSIEGDDAENKRLQQKRAESIVNALEMRQKSTIKTTVLTDYNWADFERDIKPTKHNILASMSISEAQAYIRDYNLKKELEPVLQNHRYAQIDMKVTYDITGSNEQPFVLKKFNNAVTDSDLPLVLSIEKFVMKQIINGVYQPSVINELSVPEKPEYAGVIMNKLWMQQHYKFIDANFFATEVSRLNQSYPGNIYIAFNDAFLKVTQGDYSNYADAVQNQIIIDRLYTTELRKITVDGLNIRHQFRVLNAADSVYRDPKIREACINRIKSIVDITEETMPNSLKLAELFIENNDFGFALKTLEPWVEETSDEDLLFTYVSLCSRDEYKMQSGKFTKAMLRARELNPNRFCELFNGEYFSLRVLENDEVKSVYCNYCNPEGRMAVEE